MLDIFILILSVLITIACYIGYNALMQKLATTQMGILWHLRNKYAIVYYRAGRQKFFMSYRDERYDDYTEISKNTICKLMWKKKLKSMINLSPKEFEMRLALGMLNDYMELWRYDVSI